jgi:hypothetical protein
VVGDWPEFIDDVEAHFGAGDLLPSTTILGADNTSVVVHASGDISPDMMDTIVKSMEPTPLNGHSSNAKETTLAVSDDAGSKHHFAILVLASIQLLDRTLVMLDDKEQVQEQEKDELSSASEVTDRTTDRIRNVKNLHRSIKWVSRVRVAWRPMRWP